MPETQGFRQQWIDKGYEHFGFYGPKDLSINRLSKELGLSRASFYHHFGDIQAFLDELLELHWRSCQQVYIIGAEKCKHFFPDLYVFLAEYPVQLRFNRQLYLNRNQPALNYLFIKTYYGFAKAFALKLFSEQFNLHHSKEDTLSLWITVGESWYSRLDPDQLSAEKMQQLSEEVMDSILKFITKDRSTKTTDSKLEGLPFPFH